MSSEESSSEEPLVQNKDKYRILWKLNTAWYSWTNQLGYPRPQGNLPMLQTLTSQKQESLLRAYFSVNGNNVDSVNKEWMPYE